MHQLYPAGDETLAGREFESGMPEGRFGRGTEIY